MQRRRKKRCPRRGTRNVEIERCDSGFGITISGQKPCIISAIHKHSPADLAGIRAGDFLISINGLNVSKLQHEIIVQLINNAQSKIWMGIADNYYKSDSSEDESMNILSSGRSHLGSTKLKGLPAMTPQQSPRHVPLPHTRSYEMLAGRHQQSNYRYGYPGPSSDSVLIESDPRDDCAPALEYKILVGYLGTIEMPGQLNGPRLQIVRQCIKKMRQEKRQPVAVLMTILPHCMTLRNANNQVLATFSANRMSYVSNGTQSDSERSQTNFAVITTAYYNANGVMVSPDRGVNPQSMSNDAVSNSCHVFMVNQKIVDHRVHFDKLSLFKIRCTRDPISNLCLEFPKDTAYVVNLLRSMYTLNNTEDRPLNSVAARHRAAVEDRHEAAAQSNSPQPSNHSELTTTSSNSDSGIGFHNDCSNICDRILVVDFPGLRPRTNNYRDWVGAQPANRPTGIATERDLCPIDGDFSDSRNSESRPNDFYNASGSKEAPSTEDKLTVRAMPFPRKSGDVSNTASPSRGYEERAVDVPEPSCSEPSEDLKQVPVRDDFVFRPPALPQGKWSGTKSAKQRLNFLSAKLSPKVFGHQRNRPVSQSCENITSDGDRKGARRKLGSEIDQCAGLDKQGDEYIDIWGSVTEVNAQDCQRLYSEIDQAQQRRNSLEGAISEPSIVHAVAKSLADDLIENCGNYSRPTSRNSPFRRYGQLSSSFRSQLTATEAKKMLALGSSNAANQVNGVNLPARPRSFASSDGDVYHQTINKAQTTSEAGSISRATSRDQLEKNTRVLDWNTSFERLLGDIYGVHAFAEFLKKEFSAENIYFWTACQRYKQIENASERYQEAQNIFQRHLENGAPEPVNIDSRATSKTLEQLKTAEKDLFDAAQKQIFNLMKFDSYARFIKSDIYKNCLDCEMRNQAPPYPPNGVLEEALSTQLGPIQVQSTSPVKLKKSLSNAEDRRRKSLLPWHRKTRSKSKDRNEKEANNNNIYSSRSSLSSFDAVLSAESTENQRSQLCRVILPNGATTIVQTRATETIRELVERLLEKRALPYTCFEVYVSGSNKPCDVEGVSTKIAGKQVNIEQRVTFKLDLPNKKIISVKSKPEKVLEEVLRPILHKYHYSLDNVVVHLRDSSPSSVGSKSLIKLMVTDIDGKRLTILERHAEAPTPTLHEITHRVFNEIMPEQHQQQHHQESVVSVKQMADYMNCRFAGQQMVEGSLTRRISQQEDISAKKPVIAKWTCGVNLQSPTIASVANEASIPPPRPRDHSRQGSSNFDMPSFLKTDVIPERPTPAPRFSITRNTSSSSSINNSQDSGILSNRSVLSTGTSQSECSMSQQDSHDADVQDPEGLLGNGIELDNLKSPPPPLPPKPKVLPIRGPNWGGGSVGKNIFLDQPTSSFV